jgi:flavorubredoxin
MSGDVGAALEPIKTAPLYVEDFAKHVDYMRGFHQRWMPSNRAKQNWIARVRELDIQLMAPQHGRLFRGEMVQEFLEWFSNLDVGVAV